MKSLIGDKKFYRMVLIVCIPIVIQNGFTNLASLLDNIMIGQLGTLSMSGVSISNQLFQVFNVSVFGAMSGAGIFLAQFYGRGNRDGVHNCFRIKMLLGILISILAICIFKVLGPSLISLYLNDDPTDSLTTLNFGKQYMDVMLIGLIPFAITQVYSSSLRETGNTVLPMKASVIAVIVNFCINYILIFGNFGFPRLGVIGAAIGTVISRVVNLIIVAGMGAVLIKAKQSPERIASRKIFAQIVKIGFPSALETALYNIAMTFIVRFMNQMDVDGMNVTARSYAMQIANFSYCVGAALAQANAIMTGWRIGAKKYEECDRGTRKAVIYGLVTATCFSVTFAITGRFIVHIFTNDIQMIELVVKLLVVDIFLEFGRVTNLVYGQALKTSGDAIFPVIMGAIFMYLFAVGGTYFLGIHMGLLAVGAYIAMAGDECARAVGMVLRWKSGKWKSKSLVE